MAARAEHQGAGRRMGGMKVQVTPKATTTFHALAGWPSLRTPSEPEIRVRGRSAS
jgi:hypothetical protein